MEFYSKVKTKQNNCSLWENCHATVKSEAIATCKEMLVILLNKVVDKKRIIRKRRSEEEERHKGSLTKNKELIISALPHSANSVSYNPMQLPV
jgi:hypothetical protein